LHLHFGTFDAAMHFLGYRFMVKERLLNIKDGENIALIEG
jgi:hypothetical protein